MICAKIGMPNNDEWEDVRKGNADSFLVGKEQIRKERDHPRKS